MNHYYDVQISSIVGDSIVNDIMLGVTGATTQCPVAWSAPSLLVITCPDGTTVRYNLDKVLYWQVREHENAQEREIRQSKIGYTKWEASFETDYSKFIKEETNDE